MINPPAGLAEVERHVMADEAPAVVFVDRAIMRALILYVHALEAQARRTVFAEEPEGSFW